jgi:hypothetical protein
MRSLRALAAGLGVVVGLALPVAGAPGWAVGPTIACAADTGPRAVLVVDTGSSVHRLCVALDASTVSGIHLVELASAQHGLSYSLGFGKQAVCQLDGVGVTGGDCFADYPNFWGYWHGDGAGGWSWAGGGGATFRVGDGDVEGWAWGSGDTASTHPAPPSTRADDVCPPVDPPEPAPSHEPDPPSQQGGGAGDASGGGAPSVAAPQPSTGPACPSGSPDERSRDRAEERARERERDREVVAEPDAAPAATTDDGELRATGTQLPTDEGPPIGLAAAIALGLALGAAGWWRIRRAAVDAGEASP